MNDIDQLNEQMVEDQKRNASSGQDGNGLVDVLLEGIGAGIDAVTSAGSSAVDVGCNILGGIAEGAGAILGGIGEVLGGS